MFASAVKEPISRKERIRANLENAGRNGQAAADNLDDAAHAIGKDVRDFIETTIDSASEGISQAREKISDTADTVSYRIRERPLTWAAVLVGSGLLLGALLRRR
jgi:ElaB/YqjD/DUF883 family membrane-anchored ribosome-binding protein